LQKCPAGRVCSRSASGLAPAGRASRVVSARPVLRLASGLPASWVSAALQARRGVPRGVRCRTPLGRGAGAEGPGFSCAEALLLRSYQFEHNQLFSRRKHFLHILLTLGFGSSIFLNGSKTICDATYKKEGIHAYYSRSCSCSSALSVVVCRYGIPAQSVVGEFQTFEPLRFLLRHISRFFESPVMFIHQGQHRLLLDLLRWLHLHDSLLPEHCGCI